MTCVWLEEHLAQTVDALCGDDLNSQELWEHLKTCEDCAKEFYELDQVTEVLQSTPWVSPPRIVYIHPLKEIRKLQNSLRVLTAVASVFLALALGFLSGALYLTRHRPSLGSAQKFLASVETRQRNFCENIIRTQMKQFEDRFWNEHQRVINEMIARLDSQEAYTMQIQRDLDDVRQRHNWFVQNTRESLQTLLQAANSGGH